MQGSEALPPAPSIPWKGRVYWSCTRGCRGGQKPRARSCACWKLVCRKQAEEKVNEIQAEEIKQRHRWLRHKAPGPAMLAGALCPDKGLQRCYCSYESGVTYGWFCLPWRGLTCPHGQHHLNPTREQSPHCAPFCPPSGKELEGLQGRKQIQKLGNESLRDVRSHSEYWLGFSLKEAAKPLVWWEQRPRRWGGPSTVVPPARLHMPMSLKLSPGNPNPTSQLQTRLLTEIWKQT